MTVTRFPFAGLPVLASLESNRHLTASDSGVFSQLYRGGFSACHLGEGSPSMVPLGKVLRGPLIFTSDLWDVSLVSVVSVVLSFNP